MLRKRGLVRFMITAIPYGRGRRRPLLLTKSLFRKIVDPILLSPRLWYIRVALALVAAFSLTGSVAAQSAPTYTITDLGTLSSLGDTDSNAFSVNSGGVVVGISGLFNSRIQAITPSHAYIWMPGSPNATSGLIRDLGALSGFNCGLNLDTAAAAINDSNQVVGNSSFEMQSDCFSLVTHAVLFSHGAVTDLMGLSGSSTSFAQAINNAGAIAGVSFFNGLSEGHLWLYDGTFHDLQSLPGLPISEARGINLQGQIVGFAYNAFSTSARAFLHSGTGPLASSDDIGILEGGSTALALGVNDDGSVVGNADLSTGAIHGFLFKNGKMNDLGALPGSAGNSVASAINNASDVVGGAQPGSSSDYHAVLWTNAANIVDLNT